MPEGVNDMPHRNKKLLWRLLAPSFLILHGSLFAAEAVLSFDDAWVRALPPGMGMTAGFGRLGNPGEQAVDVTVFRSPAFGDVSLHRTEQVDGVSRMREVGSVTLAPGEVLELAPGGYHLMLMAPRGPLAPGTTVVLEFTTADGRSQQFEVPVERR
jgi:copper(I)-binding protein